MIVIVLHPASLDQFSAQTYIEFYEGLESDSPVKITS